MSFTNLTKAKQLIFSLASNGHTGAIEDKAIFDKLISGGHEFHANWYILQIYNSAVKESSNVTCG